MMSLSRPLLVLKRLYAPSTTHIGADVGRMNTHNTANHIHSELSEIEYIHLLSRYCLFKKTYDVVFVIRFCLFKKTRSSVMSLRHIRKNR